MADGAKVRATTYWKRPNAAQHLSDQMASWTQIAPMDLLQCSDAINSTLLQWKICGHTASKVRMSILQPAN